MNKPMLIAGTSVVGAIHTHVDKALTHACLSRNASVQSVTQNGSFLFASATIPAIGFESRNVVLNREKSSSNAGFACMRLVTQSRTLRRNSASSSQPSALHTKSSSLKSVAIVCDVEKTFFIGSSSFASPNTMAADRPRASSVKLR